ncbi:hypothetical protein PRIC1_012137 [Phytophthora ramorum]
MHKVVSDQRLKQKLLNKKRGRGEKIVNFTEGDFVLRPRVDEKSGNKLLVTWVGPYRVMRADAHSFLIQHLITGAELDVHASRLKFYADASLDVTEELLEHISAQGIVLAVEKLKEHRWNQAINDYEILVQWKGLEPIEDSYEPLASLSRDVATLVTTYVATADDQLQEHWQRVTTGGQQVQHESAAPTSTVRPAKGKRRRRSNRQRQPAAIQAVHDDSLDVQASNRGDPARPALQPPVDPPGTEYDQLSIASETPSHAVRDRRLNMPRRPPSMGCEAVRAEDQHVSRRTRSRTTKSTTQQSAQR